MSQDIAWFAGFFDGEGYVGVGYQEPWDAFTLRASVTNNVREAVEAFHGQFGGSIRAPGAGKRSWTWHVYGDELMGFLKAIRKYVLIKQPQVDLALQFPMGRPGQRVTREQQRKRARIHQELSHAKRNSPELAIGDHLRVELQERAEVKQAVDLYRSGLSADEVAEKIGENQPTVSYWLRELGVVRDKPDAHRLAWEHSDHSVHNRPEADQAEALYKAGTPVAEIARRLKRKPATVGYWLRRRGVTRSLKDAQQLRRQREQEKA